MGSFSLPLLVLFLNWFPSVSMVGLVALKGSFGRYQRCQRPLPSFTSSFDAGNPAFLHTAPFVSERSGCGDGIDPGMGSENGESPEAFGPLTCFNIFFKHE